jgi:putative transposase
VVGVDVGLKDLLVVATPDGGEVDRIPAPKPLVASTPHTSKTGTASLQGEAA